MLSSRSTSVRLSSLGVALASVLIACGGATTGTLGDGGGGGGNDPGPSGGGNSATGSVSGTGFTVASEVAVLGTATMDCSSGGSGSSSSSSGAGAGSSTSSSGGGTTCTSSGQIVEVVLTNRADATCSVAQQAQASNEQLQFASFDELAVIVENVNGDVTPGTYPIVAQNSNATVGSGVEFQTTNATCSPVISTTAISGTVTLTTLTSGEVAGSYQASFGSEGSVSGTFDVAICNLPDSGSTNGASGPTVCK